MIALMRLFRTLQILSFQWLIACFVQAQDDFSANDTTGCTDFRAEFTITSPVIHPTDSVKWYFGFGDTLRSVGNTTANAVYTTEGQYNVVMIVNNHNPIVKDNYITVHRTVSAFFRSEEFATGNNFRFIPYDEITDPAATYSYSWEYYDSITGATIDTNTKIVSLSNAQNNIDSYTFSSGTYKVRLILSDTYGCSDTWEIPLIITDSILFPNVFVPDKPEYYEIDPKDIGIVLHLQIFNRYGSLVFDQEAPHIIWDGRTNSGRDLSTGVYYYILKATQGDPSGKYTKKGYIHLFRSGTSLF